MRNILIGAMILILSACSTEQQVQFPRQAMYNVKGNLGFNACLDVPAMPKILADLTYTDSSGVVRKEPIISFVMQGGYYDHARQCRYFAFTFEPPADAQEVIRVELTYVQDGM